MAIDTESKRRSTLGCGLVFLTYYPVSDNTIDAPDRPHSIGLYAGTGYPAPSEGLVGLILGPIGKILQSVGNILGPIGGVFKTS